MEWMLPFRNMLPPCKTSPDFEDKSTHLPVEGRAFGSRASGKWQQSPAARGLEISERLASFSRARLFRMHQRNVDEMLAQEPHLQFVSSQNVADDQIIRALVAQFGRSPR